MCILNGKRISLGKKGEEFCFELFKQISKTEGFVGIRYT